MIIVPAGPPGRIVERALEPKGLDRNEHDVEPPAGSPTTSTRLQIEVAMRAEDPQTLAPELVGASPAAPER